MGVEGMQAVATRTCRPIYLDHHATTPVDPRVAEVVIETMRGPYGNPQSVEHAYGEEAARIVDEARATVGDLVGADADNVHFTSGSTEALRMALVAAAAGRDGLRIVMPRTEHPALIAAAQRLERDGRVETIWLEVDRLGRVDCAQIAEVVRRDDLLCVMAANNEVGTIHPIKTVAALAHRRGARVLVDATQAAGRIELRAAEWGIDLLVFNAHKMYGPKGVGALVGRAATIAFDEGLLPTGGTAGVPSIAGFAAACRLRQTEGPADELRVAGLRDRLEGLLAAKLPSMVVNGDRANRLSHNLSISLQGTTNDAVLARLRHKVAISTGSACRSGAQEPSHVLRAMGLPEAMIEGTLRISPGKYSSVEDIDAAADAIANAVNALC